MPESNQPSASMFASYPSLRGRAVIVTGGATGIGASIVRHFVRQGSGVAFLDVQDEPAHKLIDSLGSENGSEPFYFHCDLTDVEAVQRSVSEAMDRLGNVVDVLVNNAGDDQRHKIEEVTPEFWIVACSRICGTTSSAHKRFCRR
jgi:NAD(P)-dependent dehydrogenase (short-subunit alcohol dehydrogenase family)